MNPSFPAVATSAASSDPVEQLLRSIPTMIQTPLFVGLVSLGMWNVMSEHSQSTAVPSSKRTNHGAFDLCLHHTPRQYAQPVPRMFSPALARAHHIDWAEFDTSVFIVVLPRSTPNGPPSTHYLSTIGRTPGILVPCTIPMQQLRSSSDPLHPFPHASLARASAVSVASAFSVSASTAHTQTRPE